MGRRAGAGPQAGKAAERQGKNAHLLVFGECMHIRARCKKKRCLECMCDAQPGNCDAAGCIGSPHQHIIRCGHERSLEEEMLAEILRSGAGQEEPEHLPKSAQPGPFGMNGPLRPPALLQQTLGPGFLRVCGAHPPGARGQSRDGRRRGGLRLPMLDRTVSDHTQYRTRSSPMGLTLSTLVFPGLCTSRM